MPLAACGKRDLRRSRYTKVQRRVGTWTLLFWTRMLMKASSEGKEGSEGRVEMEKDCFIGVVGGEGSPAGVEGPHWMTAQALAAR